MIDISEYKRQHNKVRVEGYETIESECGLNSRDPLGYHNLPHSKEDVVPLVHEMGRRAVEIGLISVYTLEDTVTAAARHDLEVRSGPGENELISDRKTRNRMSQGDVPLLNGAPASRVGRFIRGTTVEMVYDDILQAVLNSSDEEENFASRILDDGDLGSLGLPYDEYVPRFIGLYLELHRHVIDIDERRAGLLNMAEFNVRLLATHEWHTGDLVNDYRPHMRTNGQTLEATLDSTRTRDQFLAEYA